MLNNNDNNINNTPSSFASTSMSTPVAQDVLQCIVDSVIRDGMDSACCQDLIPQGMTVELPDSMPDPLEAFIRRTSGIVSPIMETPSPSCSSSSSSSIATPLATCCTGFAQCSTCGDASSPSFFPSTPSSQACQSRKAPPSSISLISHEQPFMVGPAMATPAM
ncbi:hypothetical protein BG000_002222 [Podila horticola]|nr:hypothetical protein BG000_002222 [Podila horticola]